MHARPFARGHRQAKMKPPAAASWCHTGITSRARGQGPGLVHSSVPGAVRGAGAGFSRLVNFIWAQGAYGHASGNTMYTTSPGSPYSYW